jgi:BirA family biotin operon repressor/biotin-[acetyl-CoA-carboxylase] ligase
MSAAVDWSWLRTVDDAVGDWLRVLEVTGSSNDEARKLANQGAAAGVTVWALEQTAGRGRRGAEWRSQAAESLTFSVILRPAMPRALWPRLAMVAGLAVAQAVERFGVAAEIKWPNDVLVRGCKLCGILVEAGGDHLVAGIGINANERGFSGELTGLATSLRLECGGPVAREALLWSVRERLLFLAGEAARDFGEVLAMIAERCALRGKRVQVLTGAGVLAGTMRGFGGVGELLLETEGGLQALVQADEVRVCAGG